MVSLGAGRRFRHDRRERFDVGQAEDCSNPDQLFTSHFLLIHYAYSGISSLSGGLVAAVRDSLDVAAPGDCSSAIKPKVSAVCLGPCCHEATPLSLRALRRGHDDERRR